LTENESESETATPNVVDWQRVKVNRRADQFVNGVEPRDPYEGC